MSRSISLKPLGEPPKSLPGALAVRGVLAVLSIALAGIVIEGSASFAQGALWVLMHAERCGTGRHEAEMWLFVGMPCILLAPALLWWVSRTVGLATLICRCGALASLAAWLTAAAFVVVHEPF
jgi:hypothetical protein